MSPTSIFNAPRDALIGLVRFYRFALSPWLGNACRFEPTCSAYALRALSEHGAAAGTYLTLHRIARCAPWCEGGHDPVPTVLWPTFLSNANASTAGLFRKAPAADVLAPPPHSQDTSP